MGDESTGDRELRKLITEAIVPPAYLTDPEEIEKMLDALDEGPLDDEVVQRIMAKTRGEVPLGDARRTRQYHSKK